MSESDSLGSALRDAREGRGLSVADIAAFLKVPGRIVENIEADRFDALPARVFTRTYIRRYAEFVGLQPGAILLTYDRNTDPGESSGTQTGPQSNLRRWMAVFLEIFEAVSLQSWVFGGTVVLISLLAGAFLWFVWSSGSPADAPEAPAPFEEPRQASEPATAQPIPVEDVTPSERAVPGDAPEPSSDEQVDSEEETVSAGVPGPVLSGAPDGDDTREAASNGSPDEPVSLTNPLTYVPGDGHVLHFRFSHDCWVEVTDPAGTLLHMDLERAQSELEVRGDPPFTITLGYAPGVELEYNGEPVVLSPHTHENDTAKLTLGL